MPAVFVKAKADITVNLPKPGFMSYWDSKKEERVCEDYNHPKCTINLEIENPIDPICPIMIHIGDKDAIDGGIFVTKNSPTSYTFKVDGIFKSSIHKDGVPFINAGVKPILKGVSRFRQGFAFEDPQTVDWVFSSKKISGPDSRLS